MWDNGVGTSGAFFEKQMANSLQINLTDKVVLVHKKFLIPEFKIKDRRFLCEGGFGCHPNTNGEMIYGKWLLDNEEDAIRGRWVESLVETKTTSPEIA